MPRVIKNAVFILFFLLSSIIYADDNSACLKARYDEYATNRIALFAKSRVLYKKRFPVEYKAYGPILVAHTLFARINQYVFHYFMERDISRLRLNHGITNAVPNWIKDACSGKDCVNNLYLKLAEFPEFDRMYAQWSRSRRKTKEAYNQKEIAQAGRLYLQLLKEDIVRPHAIKDMGFYGVKIGQLCQ